MGERERMLEERLTNSNLGKCIAWLLLITTQAMTMHIAYAQDDMSKAIAEANAFSKELLSGRSNPSFDSSGQLMVGGKPIMSKEELTGQRSNDYVPAGTDTYGSDSKTIIQGQLAQDKYEEKTLETAESSGERAYHVLKKSFATQKPDLTNDPMWNNTDNVLDNLTDIAKDFANCTLTTELISTGKDYHVPKYETCEKLPAIEDSFVIAHDYKVGVIKYHSGPVNLVSCGQGCLRVWIGTVGDNYWGGQCLLMVEHMSVEVIQPKAITYAKLERAKFDDYFRVSLNNTPIYVGPYAEFPTWQIGKGCELSTSWDRWPNINITSSFTNIPDGTVVQLKNETLVDSGGDAYGGEGYSSLIINYDPQKVVYDDVWQTNELIDKALGIKKQLDDGYCTGSIRCTQMPTLDANGCTVINGINVCESNFKSNPLAAAGISPFCKRVEVTSDCGFNEGQFCSKDLNGVERCFDNDTIDRNQCKKYEDDPKCSYVKTECVSGAEGSSGNCYVQEDTYDCGFTASTGTPTEEEVLRCDGKLQCIGESCYSPTRDAANEDFGKVNAYLEMLKYAKADMTCEGIPDSPYDAETPPDQYIPVPSCAEGFVYNKQTNQCLKQTGCTYSDNDFYAASPRNGIQILHKNQIQVDDASIPTCVPMTKGGVTYTCGNAMKKVATDTFYEVCTNDTSPVIPNGCPSPDHILNPKTGYCEIPPTPTCPDGVPLVEGDDPWSITDDKCLLEVPANPECNSANESYNPDTGVCEGVVVKQPTCPSGIAPVNGICKEVRAGCYWDNDSSVYYSSSKTLGSENWSHDGFCLHDEILNCYGKTDARHLKGKFWKGKLRAKWYFAPYTGGNCGATTNISYYPASAQYINTGATPRFENNGRPVNGWCLQDMTNPMYSYEICTNINVNQQAQCSSGYLLDKENNQCVKKSSTEPQWVCSTEGTFYDKATDTCRREEPAQLSCPSYYPIWNEAEGRCESKGPSPLANVRKQFEANNVELKPTETQQVIALALAPFEHMLGALVPQVTADDGKGTEEAKTTQEKMQTYVADKFLSIAEDQENNMELVAAGQQQLLGISSARSMSQPMSMNAISTQSTASASSGNANVTCELFKGTAAECKIAVGGMQNCCESPVAVTLGDYIALTTKMLEMDALTGQVMGLDGYSGVWDIASEWGSTAVDSAWNAVQGAFTSGADVAAQEAIKEGATEGIMHTVSQQMMAYTNQFLIETFGQEVASMFFQEAVVNGTTQLAASAQMAAVGQALMVVYYAYLAYVVFNLLIGIIYECEDSELDLAMKRELLSTHFLGSYCASKVLGACIEKRHSYCVFDSPLSRIMMEQIYAQSQMNLDWGTPENPNCTGVGIDQLDDVDWDRVNLDEWIGILIQTGNYKDMVNVNIDSLTGSGSNLNTKLNGVDRDNVLEANKKRMENIDGDEVRRDAYEDAWSRSQ